MFYSIFVWCVIVKKFFVNFYYKYLFHYQFDFSYLKMNEDNGWDLLTITVGGIVTFVVLYVVRNYIKGTAFHEKISARNCVAIVTGANSGIGKFLVINKIKSINNIFHKNC